MQNGDEPYYASNKQRELASVIFATLASALAKLNIVLFLLRVLT